MPDPETIFKTRCEEDTGYICRHLLGWNYDEAKRNGKKVKINIGTGGVRATGPHKLMTDLIDSPSEEKMMQGPRGCYKSTIVQGKCVKEILCNPNVRIAVGMDTVRRAASKARAIRNILEYNTKIKEIWGEQKSTHWETEFTVAGRTEYGLQEPTITVFGADTPLAGGHYDFVFPDDLVNKKNARTMAGLHKTIEVWQDLSPLLVQGGVICALGTRYHHADLYGEIERNQPDYELLILDAGVTMDKKKDGGWRLLGEPLFEHISMERLNRELNKGYYHFMTQYMNQIPVGTNAGFTREMFKCVRIRDLELHQLSGYLLTDTAVTTKEEGCLSVLAYVAFDQQLNLFLLDMECGHWHPKEFEQRYFGIRQRWMQRVNHIGETMEKVTLNYVFKANLEAEAQNRRERLNIIDLPRGGGELSKEQRIASSMSRFANGRFFVVDSVPRTYIDVGQVRVLFDPEGYVDEDGHALPCGELVDQYIHFPRWPLRDIPDALADSDALRPDGTRYCLWRPPLRKQNMVQPMFDPSRYHPAMGNLPRIKEKPSGHTDWVDLAYEEAFKTN